ncbi:MAG: oligosaccharide flippase family protein [Ignavibacteriales bacterium]|nr:oligosaccharide flippase family protein [Ignavibacteriales bacterium]
MEKHLHYKGLSIIKTSTSIVSVCVAIFLAIGGFGIWSLVARELFSVLVSLIGFRYTSGWQFRWKFNRDLARKLMTFGNKMLLSRGLEAAFYRMDNLLIGMIGGVSMLGYYSQARYLVDLANAAVAPATAVVALPVYSRMQHDADRLREAYRIGNYFLIRVMFPVSIVLVLFPTELISFLFGVKWMPAADALRWLALYAVMVPVFENLKTLLYGIGRVGTTAWIRGLQIATAIPMIWLGLHYFGLGGAAIGFMVSILLGSLAIYVSARRYTLESLRENFLSPFWVAIVAGALGFWLKYYWFHNPSQGTVLGLAVLTILMYATVLFLTERRLLTGYLRMIFGEMKAAPRSAIIGK